MIEYEEEGGNHFEGILSKDYICLYGICDSTKVKMEFAGAKWVENFDEKVEARLGFSARKDRDFTKNFVSYLKEAGHID